MLGYGVTSETAPGIWTTAIVEKKVKGDLLQNRRTYSNRDSSNGNVNISNRISIVADPYSMHNFHLIRYAEFMGVKWMVTDVEVQYPRLILSLGGEYHE